MWHWVLDVVVVLLLPLAAFFVGWNRGWEHGYREGWNTEVEAEAKSTWSIDAAGATLGH